MSEFPPAIVGSEQTVQRVGVALTAAGFTPPRLKDLLGSDGALVDAGRRPDALRHAHAGGDLGVLARLFLLADGVSDEELSGLGTLAEDLRCCGLVSQRGGVNVGAATMIPHDDILIASDGPGSDVSDALVPGVQGPSHLLGMLAIRRPVQRALDLGTGNGIQAILLARSSEHVVATDLNPRAIAYARFNAALNGVTNIEFRQGDLFEPVAGERFGLAVANPPYVISPETSFTFRDSVLGGEAISAQVVVGMSDVLEEGGHATVLVSWDASGADPHATPVGWVAGLPVDGVVLSTTIEPARSNAERWTAAHADRDAAFAQWYDYYVANGIEHVGYAAVVMRRRERHGRHRVIAVPPTMASQASDHLLRLLDGQGTTVAEASIVRLAPTTRITEVTEPGPDGWALASAEISLADGLGFRADLDVRGLAVVRSLVSQTAVADLPGDDADEVLGFVRELVELGFVVTG